MRSPQVILAGLKARLHLLSKGCENGVDGHHIARSMELCGELQESIAAMERLLLNAQLEASAGLALRNYEKRKEPAENVVPFPQDVRLRHETASIIEASQCEQTGTPEGAA
jgi:hypothetical protein